MGRGVSGVRVTMGYILWLLATKQSSGYWSLIWIINRDRTSHPDWWSTALPFFYIYNNKDAEFCIKHTHILLNRIVEMSNDFRKATVIISECDYMYNIMNLWLNIVFTRPTLSSVCLAHWTDAQHSLVCAWLADAQHSLVCAWLTGLTPSTL